MSSSSNSSNSFIAKHIGLVCAGTSIFNLGLGLPLIFNPPFEGIYNVQPRVNGVFITLLGIAYGIAARDPASESSRAILILAVAGKSLVACVMAWHFWMGDVPVEYIVVGAIDLMFAALFAWYLRDQQMKRAVEAGKKD
ncbi:hypothetical protein HDU80_004155 [Chytriomyces hyalinus]|nr:hypothetical protein HDU80_004155 [Chytriomyces hyalinus]